VTSPAHLAVGLVVAIAVGWWTAAATRMPVAGLAVAAVVAATAVLVSTVRTVVGPRTVTIGMGPCSRPARTIPAESVVSASTEQLDWPQVFGLGVPWHGRTSRHTVRPGATLLLTLASGEQLRISTRDPDAAIACLAALDRPDKGAHHG
jgi:hypothetical protein